MGVFEHFPYTNFHDLNLDWIVQELEKLTADVRDFISINAIKYANPIQWDITNQYEKNTVVLDKDGNAYLSVQPVPAGVSLDRTEYWTNIGNFSALWESVKAAIAIPDEGHETTASAKREPNTLVWVNGQLLLCVRTINAGDQYTTGEDGNSVVYNMQQLLNTLLSEISNRENADSDMDVKISENSAKITQLEEKIAGIASEENRKFIFIGDSYSVGVGAGGKGWVYYVTQFLNLTKGVNCFYAEEGVTGMGFAERAGLQNFTQTLENLLGEIAKPDEITDIYAFAGYNDAFAGSFDDVKSGIASFCAFAKSNFKNAKINIGYIAHYSNYVYEFDAFTKAYNAYRQCGAYGAAYIANCEKVVKNLSYYSDEAHLKSDGYQALGEVIASTIKNGDAMFIYPANVVTLQLNTEKFQSADVKFVEYVNQGIWRMRHNSMTAGFRLNLNTPGTLGTDGVLLGTANFQFFGGVHDVTTQQNIFVSPAIGVTAILTDTNGKQTTTACTIVMNYDKLMCYFPFAYEDIGVIDFVAWDKTFDTLYA